MVGLRSLAKLAWLCAVVASPAARADEASASPAAGTEAAAAAPAGDPEKLVEQLGADAFVERERACEQLVEFGLPALPALERGLKHPDREIRFRCERIIALVEESDFERRLEAFASGKIGDTEARLPGWPRHVRLLGDSAESRKFYIDVLRQESEFLRSLAEAKESAPTLLLARVQQLQRNYQVVRQVTPTSVAAMLSLIADPEMPIDDNVGMQVFNFCNMPGATTAFEVGEFKDFYRKLLATCITRGGGQNMNYQALTLAMRLNLPEGLRPAEELAKGAAGNPWMRQMAIFAIGKLGNEKQIPLLESLLTDQSVCHQQHQTIDGRRVMYTTKVCDCALAVLVHLEKQNHKDYGMARISTNPQYLFTFGTMGYESEAEREAALKKWHDFQAQKKPAVKEGTPPPAP